MASPLQARRLPAAPKVALDPWITVSAVALASIGVVMVASSSIAIAEELHVGPFYFLTKHLMFLALACPGLDCLSHGSGSGSSNTAR